MRKIILVVVLVLLVFVSCSDLLNYTIDNYYLEYLQGRELFYDNNFSNVYSPIEISDYINTNYKTMSDFNKSLFFMNIYYIQNDRFPMLYIDCQEGYTNIENCKLYVCVSEGFINPLNGEIVENISYIYTYSLKEIFSESF